VPESLFSALARHLQAESRPYPATTASPVVAPSHPPVLMSAPVLGAPPSPPPQPLSGGIDGSIIAGLVEQLGLDTTQEICRLFATQLDERRDRMAESAARGDLQEVARLAHAVKGMSANLGFTALHALAMSIEQACRAGDDRDVAALIGRLDLVIAEALFALNQQTPVFL
jgi:HPt (histidine-containing phosphotransfer) domain-containing protein